MSRRRRQLRELALLARISEEERREDTWEQVLNGTPATVTPIRSNRVGTANSFGPFDEDSDEEAEDIRSVDTLYYDSEQEEPEHSQIVQEPEISPVQLFDTQANNEGPAPIPAAVPIINASANNDVTKQALLLFNDDEDMMFKYDSGYLLQKIKQQNKSYAVIASPARTNVTDLQK